MIEFRQLDFSGYEIPRKIYPESINVETFLIGSEEFVVSLCYPSGPQFKNIGVVDTGNPGKRLMYKCYAQIFIWYNQEKELVTFPSPPVPKMEIGKENKNVIFIKDIVRPMTTSDFGFVNDRIESVSGERIVDINSLADHIISLAQKLKNC